jgi:hypothetical protein
MRLLYERGQSSEKKLCMPAPAESGLLGKCSEGQSMSASVSTMRHHERMSHLHPCLTSLCNPDMATLSVAIVTQVIEVARSVNQLRAGSTKSRYSCDEG